ncbi:hypothetical protein GALMADRAFT_134340 [Galerina marginata CBS 339.88]|uniref:Bud22 domain-containing protein n=1 Tax=Galerina marginata (strain CBS 339.88) TaxID=685588 RepID=A0A067TKB9_GALM3|nr:hypothetical protein GALMADRAFT_134340 [Galerina marginata CBS 339.88]
MDPNSNRGVKRKRYEPPEEDLSVRIGGKLHHEMKEIHKASKRARVFETQKVVKRLKDIRKKDEMDNAIEGLEAELRSLKDIDHDAIGNSALRSKVLKDHTLRDSQEVKTSMKKELESHLLTPAEPGAALAKVQSRLLSSKILAIQVAASLNTLKILLNPALRQRDNDMEPDVDATPIDLNSSITEPPLKLRKGFTPNDFDPKNKPANSTPLLPADHLESQYDSAGSVSGNLEDRGDDGWESGSINSSREENESDHDWESGRDPDSDNEDLKVVSSTPQIRAPFTKTAKGAPSKLESTFLPSLSVGFVRGTDDSDWSEAEGHEADMPKKNRRGQRARRAIWEKKFGRNANHKKKEAEAASTAQLRRNRGHTSNINTGSNAIRALPATQSRNSSNRSLPRSNVTPQQTHPVDSGWGVRTGGVSGGNSFRPSASNLGNKAEKPLHPSWEAKRRLKEKESVGIVPSKGTKIKFS